MYQAKAGGFDYADIPAGYYYKAMRSGHPAQRFWHRYKFESVAERIPSGSHVLDLGCGPGSFLSVLSEKHTDITATGVDIAEEQIAFARVHACGHQPNIQFLSADTTARQLPFDRETFDVATSIEVIEHIHPYLALRMLAEAKRVLKPKGKLIVTTPNYRSFWPLIEKILERVSPVPYNEQHISKFTPNALVKFVESAGFSITSVSSIFVAAPFLAPISWRLAERVHRWEQTHLASFGSLLVLEAENTVWI